jgi:TatD DNase family protein
MIPVGLIDTHCHLADRFFREQLPVELDKARSLGVTGWVSTALTRGEVAFHETLDEPSVRWTAGIPPMQPSDLTLDDLSRLIQSQYIAGIGEIGLDTRFPDIPKQAAILESQLELARDTNLPVVFHIVRAWPDFLRILKRFPNVRGILHGFTGNRELVEQCKQYELEFSLGHLFAQTRDAATAWAAIRNSGRYTFETDAPVKVPHSREPRGLDFLPEIFAAISQLDPNPIQPRIPALFDDFAKSR